jgi:hypothetical protein
MDLRRDGDCDGQLTPADQAALDAVREGLMPGAVLLGSREARAGPVIEGEARETDERRALDRDD